MPLPDKVYDILRYVSNYVLPGLGTLYFALAQIWGFPYGQQVVGSITAVVTFLNVLLGASTVTYNQQNEIARLTTENLQLKGQLYIDQLPDEEAIEL